MKLKQYNNIIAIDPDVDKSGVAYLHKESKKLESSSLAFADLLDYLQNAKEVQDKTKDSLLVVVEASWMIKSNWHLTKYDSRPKAAAKGHSVGRNHEVGHKIVEMCKHYDIEILEHMPLQKGWKGADGKITHKELASFTGIMGRTNQEMRDACLLAWCVAGLPIRLKCG